MKFLLTPFPKLISWRRTRLPNDDVVKLVEKLGDRRNLAYERLKEKMGSILPFSQMHIKYWTEHGKPHSERVVQQLARMIPQDMPKKLNSCELFVLLCSAWLHDIGYLTNKDISGRKLTDPEIQDRHHELSRDLINKLYEELGLEKDVAELVADVCFCHRRRVNIGEYLRAEIRYLPSEQVRIRLLAALLRLADALDTTTRRAPEMLLKGILDLPQKSERHWKACQLIKGSYYKLDSLEILIDASYQNEQEIELFMWKFKDLYEDYASIRQILIDNGLRYVYFTAQLTNGIRRDVTNIKANEYFGEIPQLPSWNELKKSADKASKRVLDSMREDKYDPELYIDREDLEKLFEQFLKSDRVGLAIVGESGFGKTNFLCHLTEKYSGENIVLLYYGPFLTKSDLAFQVTQDLLRPVSFRSFAKKVCELTEKEKQYLIVLIDSINEYDPPSGPAVLLKNLNALVGEIDCPRIKIVLTCRRVVWDLLFDVGKLDVYRQKFFELRGGEGVTISKFTEQELKMAYPRYKKKFAILTNLDDLSAKAQEALKDPVMLGLVSKAYNGKAIPREVELIEAFKAYYDSKVRGSRMEDFLRTLALEMWSCGKDRLPRFELRKNNDLRQEIDDESLSSPYVKLKDCGIIYEFGPLDEVKFTYDRFFEYLLAKEITSQKPLTKEKCLALANEAEAFGALRGALKMALVMEDRWDMVRALTDVDDYSVRKICIDTLAGLAIKDRQRTIDLMKSILVSGSVLAKRLMVLASCEVSPSMVDVLAQAMSDEDEAVRGLAVQYSYLLWIRDPKDGEKIAKLTQSTSLPSLVLSAKSRRAFRSSLELQSKIFLNHYKDPDAVRLVDRLGLERLRATLSSRAGRLATRIGIRVATTLFTKFLGWSYKEWVAPVFPATEEYRKTVANTLPYLDPRRKLSEEAVDDLYEAASGPLRGVATIVLIIQTRTNPEISLPLLRKLIKSNDERRVLKGLQALAFASRAFSLSHDDFVLAETMITGKKQYRKGIREFGINLASREPGEIGFITSIIESATKEKNIEVLRDAITELGIIGVLFPDSALLTLKQTFDSINLKVHESLVKSLARIRIVHPNKVEVFLRNNRRQLLDELPVIEPEHTPLEGYGFIDFFIFATSKMPLLIDVTIEVLQKFIEIRSKSDFRETIKFVTRRSVETWMDRTVVEEYLRRVEEDAMA